MAVDFRNLFKLYFIFPILFCCFCDDIAITPPTVSPRDYQYELVHSLTSRGYSKLSKPMPVNNNETFTVKVRLYIVRIQQVDEFNEKLSTTFRLQLSWRDPRLSWFPGDFGGLLEAVVPAGFLWVPPFHVANSFDESAGNLHHSIAFPFRVKSDGKVWYHPTGQAVTRCKFDFTYYPFDIQRCIIILESEIYQENEMRLEIRKDDRPGAISFGMLAENEVWDLLKEHTYGVQKVYQSGSDTAFSRVHFVLVMKRKATFFVVTGLIPAIVLSIINLLTYFIPVHYVDRPVQSVTTVLAIAIFAQTVAEKLPSNSANCLLTIHLTTIMCSSAVTVLTSTICLVIVDPGEHLSAPWGIPNIFRAFFSRCHKETQQESSNDERRILLENSSQMKRSKTGYSCSYSMDSLESRKEKLWKSLCHETSFLKSRLETFSDFNIPQAKLVDSTKPAATKSTYEAGRRLKTGKTTWYIAYTANWIGFLISLVMTTFLPFTALVTTSNDSIALFNRTRKNDEAHLDEINYFGDS